MEKVRVQKSYSLFNIAMLIIMLSGASPILAANTCSNLFDPQILRTQHFSNNSEDYNGAIFLHQRNQDIFKSKFVQQTALKNNFSFHDPINKLSFWLDTLTKNYAKHSGNSKVLKRIKEAYLKKSIIKENEIPESYYEHQAQIALEQGHGHITLTEEQKSQIARIAIRDQKESLEQWIDYFLSPDSVSYPMWVKYWVYQGVLKLGKFDKEKGIFEERSRGQVAPYPELNREALAIIVDGIIKHVNKKSLADIKDPQFLELLKNANFGKLYAKVLLKTNSTKTNLTTTDGVWVKYQQGSDETQLVESLKGKNTGWCTAGQATAEAQLKVGDFYVYYSNDNFGRPIQPRLAIRMVGDSQIAEVRGIGKDQNIDSEILKTDILKNKLLEFGEEGKKYEKKSADMKRLTMIYYMAKKHEELSSEDLRFLYEIDEKIVGFGYTKDPRIEEIKKGRNIRQDISKAFNGKFREDEISLTQEEALKGGIKFHYGDLYLRSLTDATGLKLPEYIYGDLDLISLTDATGLKLPEHIGRNLYLASLTDATGLKLPVRLKILAVKKSNTQLIDLAKSLGIELIYVD